ncbi:MAG: epoxyqueuosine reductase QueH [Bacilli bacterium]|nr:epoxyqueuosine reductase QueH [Bacilli bacterium]
MNVNYQKKLEELVESLDYTPKLLLHSCCAPCSSRCIEYLSNYFDITVIYYNPNISPITEYEKRKEEQKKFISEFKSKNKLDFIEVGYDYNDFLKIAKGLEHAKEGGERCFKCYRMRLEKTAQVAHDRNYDYFGTTLTVSPYKNSQVLNKIGEELSEKYNIKYLYSDFKKNNGYKRSIELSKVYNLYRQDYCGCIYSKMERDEKIEKLKNL